MFDRFTDNARTAIRLAKEETWRLNHEYLGTEHILLGLARLEKSGATTILSEQGLNAGRIRREIEKLVKGDASVTPMATLPLPFTPRAKKALELSLEEASQLGHNHIGSEHLLLGLLAESEGIAARVLTNLGADLEKMLTAARKIVVQRGYLDQLRSYANSLRAGDRIACVYPASSVGSGFSPIAMEAVVYGLSRGAQQVRLSVSLSGIAGVTALLFHTIVIQLESGLVILHADDGEEFPVRIQLPKT